MGYLCCIYLVLIQLSPFVTKGVWAGLSCSLSLQ